MKKKWLFIIILVMKIMILASCNYPLDLPSTQIPEEPLTQEVMESSGHETPEPTGQEISEPSDYEVSKPAEQENPEPSIQEEPEPSEQEFPETPELPVSVAEAQTILNIRFGEHGIISYMPNMDKQVDGVLCYCFIADYFGVLARDYASAHAPTPTTHAYVWVNPSAMKIMEWQEAGYTETNEPILYTNIPDNMFPIPMIDNMVIPYERFVPPQEGYAVITYTYTDISIMESYQVQLQNAGFTDYGSSSFVDSFWKYERNDDRATLCVEIIVEDRLAINMYVNYSPS